MLQVDISSYLKKNSGVEGPNSTDPCLNFCIGSLGVAVDLLNWISGIYLQLGWG